MHFEATLLEKKTTFVCVHLCGCFNLCASCDFAHTAMIHFIPFSHTAVKKLHSLPQFAAACTVYCDSSHLSVLETSQCSVGTFKRGRLYYNQTLIKLAVALPEMHALQ